MTKVLAVILSVAMGVVAHADQIKQITYSYKGTKYLLQISFDAKAQTALAANPIPASENGAALVDELQQRGGVLKDVKQADGVLVPSEQQFSERTGKKTAIIYRHAGQQQDPAPGVAAVQGWDEKTGAVAYTFYFQDNKMQDPPPGVPASTQVQDGVTVYEHYQAGNLEDPQKGIPARRCVNKAGKCLWEGHYKNNLLQDSDSIPAYQEFDPATGHLTLREYCQNGLFEDPANGEPAKQVYDGKTGALISASQCRSGKVTHVLDAKELAVFAAKKNV